MIGPQLLCQMEKAHLAEYYISSYNAAGTDLAHMLHSRPTHELSSAVAVSRMSAKDVSRSLILI